jgi:hypothetical protein
MKENEIGTIIVNCAVQLHRNLGPGLLETVYEVTLARALEHRGLRVERQGSVAIEYEGYLDSEPPCLRGSVRRDFIEPAGARRHRGIALGRVCSRSAPCA